MSQPTKMYAVQAPAYDQLREYQRVTTSTPTEPPKRCVTTAEDMCASKRDAIQNKPENCSHCGAALEKSCFEELKGSIYAYCRGLPSSCGKSQVLFVTPSLVVHEYSQVCVFDPVETEKKPEPEKKIIARPYVQPKDRHDPNTLCKTCGNPFSVHKTDCDSNGWRIVKSTDIEIPEDWPVYQGKGEWSHV